MEETLESIEEEKILKLRREIKKLYAIWDVIGIENERKIRRSKTAWGHITGILQQMLKEENYFYNILSVRVKEFSKEISELSKQLLVPCAEETEGTLLIIEETLKKKLSSLKEIKDVRMKKFKELRDAELKYCKILDWSALEISSETGVPSERDISQLEKHISVLQQERNVRFKRLCTAKRELTTILEETEIQAETSFEKEILGSNEEDISLADETFATLDGVVKKVRSRKADLENEKKTLLEKLTNLWERLQISENEKRDFMSKHKDNKVSTLKSMEDEIEKCEKLKRENLEKCILELREELQSLWQNCFVSDEEKEKFFFLKSNDFTDETLQAHEVEVEKWRMFYTKIEKMRNKIEKRNKLWDLLIAFENKASDPNRFKNRRGILLKEEKERRKLSEDLPDLENEIFVDIETFEAENGVPFLYRGENYRAAITKQWDERRFKKESEKITRHKEHMLQVENEATFGTPIVKRINCASPRSAPSQQSMRVAACLTPRRSSARSSPFSVGKNTKLSSVKNCLFYSTPQRPVLKEKGQTTDASNSNDDTTYSVFAGALNKSSRRLFHSSTLSSKKVVGTRIANGNKYKQRSPNRALRKSTKNPDDVSTKLTPSRRNVGLPFLI